jgi:triosephosphate isomerase
MARRKLIAGNWKMNGLRASLGEARAIAAGCPDTLDALLCPPATLVGPMAQALAGTAVMVGGQDCHPKASGAHTGDISADMLVDAGATAVIVGHSERRQDHAETDQMVAAKAQAAWRAGLVAVICVGETRAQRESGQTLDVIGTQISGSLPDDATAANTVIAYEPVWAIGTGLVPTPADVAEVHAFIRARLAERVPAHAGEMRILYGGSVKPENAGQLIHIEHVDGALVGGASLKASDFLAIIAAVGR